MLGFELALQDRLADGCQIRWLVLRKRTVHQQDGNHDGGSRPHPQCHSPEHAAQMGSDNRGESASEIAPLAFVMRCTIYSGARPTARPGKIHTYITPRRDARR